jgi:hypothetical protein
MTISTFGNLTRKLCYYILDLTQCTKPYALFHFICPFSRRLYAMLPKQATGLLMYETGVVVLSGPRMPHRIGRSSCGVESTILLHMPNSVRRMIGRIPPYIFTDASLVIDVTYLCCMRVCVVRRSQMIRRGAYTIACTFAYSSSLRSSIGTSIMASS